MSQHAEQESPTPKKRQSFQQGPCTPTKQRSNNTTLGRTPMHKGRLKVSDDPFEWEKTVSLVHLIIKLSLELKIRCP